MPSQRSRFRSSVIALSISAACALSANVAVAQDSPSAEDPSTDPSDDGLPAEAPETPPDATQADATQAEAASSEEAAPPRPSRNGRVVHVIEKPSGAWRAELDLRSTPAEIEAYVKHLEDRRRDLERELRGAKRRGDNQEAYRIRLQIAALERERDQLVSRNEALVGIGGTTLGLGGASLVASFAMFMVSSIGGAIGDGFSSLGGGGGGGGGGSDGLKAATIGCFVGGLAGVGAGAGMLGAGLKRRPREAGDVAVSPVVDVQQGGGLAMTVSF